MTELPLERIPHNKEDYKGKMEGEAVQKSMFSQSGTGPFGWAVVYFKMTKEWIEIKVDVESLILSLNLNIFFCCI